MNLNQISFTNIMNGLGADETYISRGGKPAAKWINLMPENTTFYAYLMSPTVLQFYVSGGTKDDDEGVPTRPIRATRQRNVEFLLPHDVRKVVEDMMCTYNLDIIENPTNLERAS